MNDVRPGTPQLLLRAVTVAVIGALAGALCVVLTFARQPALVLEMDRDLPRLISGFYPVERQGDQTFAWTAAQAAINLRGLDRRAPWACVVRLRGARPGQIPQPVVVLAADGITLVRHQAGNDYQDVEVTAPARATDPGLTLTIATSPVFVPSPGDRRELGVQVDRLTCQPAAGGVAVPPRRVIAAAATAGAVFGAAFGLVGAGWWWAVGATLGLAVAQALPLTAGPAPYSAYQDSVGLIAIWIAAPITLAMWIAERWKGARLQPAARFVVLFSGAVLFLKLLALLHPSKLIVDAVFHAHRFEWVLAGRYYFTQPMPSGVQFPYAIALYVFAAPWSALTRDHVTLLRIVVCAAQACAGAMLYPMVVRSWNDRHTAVAAVVLFHLVPLPYIIIGNANLTHAFGQSAALAAVAAATVWRLGERAGVQIAGLSALCALAFLSHVGAFPLLLSTLVGTAVLYRVRGGAALAPAARAVLLASALAVALSLVTYYGHFVEVYKTLDNVRGRTVAAPAATGADATAQPERRAAGPAPSSVPIGGRLVQAGALGLDGVGWPIAVLASIGAWRVSVGRGRDRLALAIAASGATAVGFLAFSVLTPVDPRFQRYTDEFILRVYDATGPAFVILAARAAVWGWRAGLAPRIATAALLVAAGVLGVQQWLAWLQ